MEMTGMEMGSMEMSGMGMSSMDTGEEHDDEAPGMPAQEMNQKPGHSESAGMEHHGMGHGNSHHRMGDGDSSAMHQAATDDGIEWEDTMPEMNVMSNRSNMVWKVVDTATGAANAEIAWKLHVGDRVKIRLDNSAGSDHQMHHPFHIHGAGRFLVLDRAGVPEPNLVWKDTVLVRAGEVVHILFDATNPGRWMAHCHIAEHIESGMMFSFDVLETSAA
jgi:FtsP/CotA-like multicopper oxidase with cupredoxin domain